MRKIRLTSSKVATLGKTTSIFLPSPSGEYCFDGVQYRKMGELESGSELILDVVPWGAELVAVTNFDDEDQRITKLFIPDGNRNFWYKLCLGKRNDLIFKQIKRQNPMRIFILLRRQIIACLAVILCLGICFGVEALYRGIRSTSKTPAHFQKNEVGITLSDAFAEVDGQSAGFYAAYATNSCTVTITREGYDQTPIFEEMLPEDFLNEFLASNFFEYQEIRSDDGLDYVVFEAEFEKVYRYHLYVFKTDEAIWVVEFSCPKNMYNYWSGSFNEWAKSINFK